jgi:long-chain acyl-CoA synthetase
MIYGDGRPYNVALIVIDLPYLRAYLGGDQRTDDALIADPRTRQIMEDEVLRYSRDFRTFELVRKFWLTREPFAYENGMLTNTFKLRRRDVLKVYEGRLQSLY